MKKLTTLFIICFAIITTHATAQLVANAGNLQNICLGSSVTLGGNPTAGGGTPPYSYTWNPATGLNSASIANPTATPTTTSSYTLTVTDGVGATAFAWELV